MDNRIVSVQSEGRKAFDLAFEILFEGCPGGKALGYVTHPAERDSKQLRRAPRLVLFWSTAAGATPFPVAQGWELAAENAWAWLQAQDEKDYAGQIDLDGSLGKGWRVYNEDWGHVDHDHYAFLAVEPVMAWYGK